MEAEFTHVLSRVVRSGDKLEVGNDGLDGSKIASFATAESKQRASGKGKYRMRTKQ